MHCSKCGAELKEGANFCTTCGNLIKPAEAMAYAQNDSGQGTKSVLPSELRHWNWGAFLLNWIWAIGNSVWIGLLALVPYVGFIMCFVLGAKGNEWAWQQKRWESVEQFRRAQKRWTNWGVGLLIASLIIVFLFFALVASKAKKSGLFNPPPPASGIPALPQSQVY